MILDFVSYRQQRSEESSRDKETVKSYNQNDCDFIFIHCNNCGHKDHLYSTSDINDLVCESCFNVLNINVDFYQLEK
jgi:ribosomal protein S27E